VEVGLFLSARGRGVLVGGWGGGGGGGGDGGGGGKRGRKGGVKRERTVGWLLAKVS